MSAASSFIVHFPVGSTCKHNKVKQPSFRVPFALKIKIFYAWLVLHAAPTAPPCTVRTLSLRNDAEKRSLLMDTVPLPKDSAIASAMARALPTT